MQLFEAIFQPMTLETFREHYTEGRCLVLEGSQNKFEKLVSPADIERRLNDGCNANHFPQVIKSGARGSSLENNCAWSPAALRKTEFTNDIRQGLSFMMPNSSQITPGIARLCSELESFFAPENMHADAHLYISTSAAGNSYDAHRDLPQHKILLQALGDTDWQIFEPTQEIPKNVRAIANDEQANYLKVVSEFTLTQGDLLYMPPGTFHRVTKVSGPRISISIPFYALDDTQQMDRSHIPFAEIFATMPADDKPDAR